MRLLEGLSETLRFSIFSSLFFLSLYFLSYIFLYHKIHSLFLFLHPKNNTLAHLTLSVGNHHRVVPHQFWYQSKNSWHEGICNWGVLATILGLSYIIAICQWLKQIRNKWNKKRCSHHQTIYVTSHALSYFQTFYFCSA